MFQYFRLQCLCSVFHTFGSTSLTKPGQHFVQITMKSSTIRASMELSAFWWFLSYTSPCFILSISSWGYLYSIVWNSMRTEKETYILILQHAYENTYSCTNIHIHRFFSKNGHNFFLLTEQTRYLRLRIEEKKCYQIGFAYSGESAYNSWVYCISLGYFFISIHKHVSWKQPSYHFTVIQPTLLYISASDNLHAVPKNMVMYSECVVKCIRRKAKLFYMPLHCCVYSDNEIYGLCELKDGKSIPVHVLQIKNRKLKWEFR